MKYKVTNLGLPFKSLTVISVLVIAGFSNLGWAKVNQCGQLFENSRPTQIQELIEYNNSSVMILPTRAGQKFEKVTFSKNYKKSLNAINIFVAYVEKYEKFLSQLGYSFSAKETHVLRPSNAQTQNQWIADYNSRRPKEEHILTQFWDDFTKDGFAGPDNFYSHWEKSAAWPIQQVNAETHVHDLTNHAVPILALPAEVVIRSQKNFSLIAKLRQDELFKNDKTFQYSVDNMLNGPLESSAEMAFIDLIDAEDARAVWHWNGLILSKSLIKTNLLRDYVKGKQRIALNEMINQMAQPLTAQESRRQLEIIHRRLQGD